MPFKYMSNHRECIACKVNFLTNLSSDQLAYRLVPDSLPTSSDFLPPAVMNPRRSFRSAEQRCSAYALSFFQSAENARNFRKKLLKQSKAFNKMTCIAETALQPLDGEIGPTDSKGHFDLHEYTEADLAASVKRCEAA